MQHCVLIVDGDPRSLRLLEVGLAQAGYRVLSAPGAVEATQLLDAEVPDLVIADARGADGGGFALQQTAATRPAWKRVPFLFLLQEDDAAGRMRAAQLGAGEFLIKPVYLKEALSRVALLLEKQAQRGERARFSGALSGTALLDLIQSMELSRRSGVAYVSAAGGQRGRLFFDRGQLVDAVFAAGLGAELGGGRGPDEPGAELPSLSGDDAFFRMLTCEGGEYRVEPIEVAREPRMSLSSSELLMEATRRLTHWQRATAALPPLGSVLIAAPAGALRPETLPPDVRDVLRVFDGRRTISEALAVLEHEDAGGRDPVQRLAVIAKLYAARLLTAVGRPVSGEPRKAAPTPVGLPRLTPASLSSSRLSSPSLPSLSAAGDGSDAALRRVPLNLPAAVLPLPQQPRPAGPADTDATPLPFPIAPRPTPPPMPAVSALSRPTPPPMPALSSVSRLTPPPMPAVSVFSRPTPPPMPGVSGVLRPTPPPVPAVGLQAPAPGEGLQEAPALITQLAQRLAATRAPTPFPHLEPIPGSPENRADRTAVEPQGGAVAVAAAVAVSEPVPVSDSQLIVLHSRPERSGDGTEVPAIRPAPAAAIIEHTQMPTVPAAPAVSRPPSRPPSTPPISIPHPAAVGSANLAPLGPAELLRSGPAAAGGRSWSLRLLAAAGLLGLGAGLYLLIHAPAGRSRPPEVAQPAPPPPALLPAVPIIPPAPPAAAPAASAPTEITPAAPAPNPAEEPAAPVASAASAAASPGAPVPAEGASPATAAPSDPRPDEPAGRSAPSSEARLAQLLDKGRSLQRRGLTRQAEHVARTAQRLQPTSAEPVALLAQLALDQGDGPKAARLARQAQRLDARNADAVLVLGTVEQALGHHARARALLRRYLELAPDGERAPDVRAVLRLPR